MTWADRGTLAVHARKADGSSSGSWPGCSSRGSGRNAKWTRSKWPPSGVGISKWRWPWSWRLQRGTRPRRCRRCGHLASEPSAGRAGSRESDVAARPLLLLSEQARALLSHWRDDCVSLPWHAPRAIVRHVPHFHCESFRRNGLLESIRSEISRPRARVPRALYNENAERNKEGRDPQASSLHSKQSHFIHINKFLTINRLFPHLQNIVIELQLICRNPPRFRPGVRN